MAISEALTVKPLFFVNYSSNGNDWVYDKEPITSFGAGFNFNFVKKPWKIEGQYIQLGFLVYLILQVYISLLHLFFLILLVKSRFLFQNNYP